MRRTRHFAHESRSVTAARRFATDALADESPELLATVELLVSELASNCVRHTDSDFELTITSGSGEICIAATDRGAGEPVMRAADPLAVSGRGLAIIDMMSTAWGVDHATAPSSGKIVWFKLPATQPTAVPALRD